MLLTITYTGHETQNLGYLLHKNPDRPQQFEISCGKAYVFYPEVTEERTTAALLLDIDPIDLAKGKVGSSVGGLFDYVNDRPYTSSTFMSSAISKVFGTAMSGRCNAMQQLADTPLDLSATLYSLKDGGLDYLAKQMFEPLGYEVETKRTQLDEKFPEWGMAPYIDLTIRGKVKLSQLLNHIYVLIGVFDPGKHYYVSESEVNKLLDHGKDWLPQHPYKDKIMRRFLGKQSSYIKAAREALSAAAIVNEPEEQLNEKVAEAQEKKSKIPLGKIRLETVLDTVKKSGAKSVIDMGCGEGRLTSLLLKEEQIKKVTACDVSTVPLEKAEQRLVGWRIGEEQKAKLSLIQASLVYNDKRFKGYDCACIIEVIEHIDPSRIPFLEKIVFGIAKPKTVIVTTPNREYNTLYGLDPLQLRHSDHRFEWTRAEFAEWVNKVCEEYGYTSEISGIGDADETYGTPTQMAVFSLTLKEERKEENND